jgi:hypothetical protein
MIIALLNASTRYKDKPEIINKMVTAVNTQLVQHVCPSWGLAPWQCVYYPSEKMVPPGSYRLWLLDNSDAANALGYHAQDASGMPYGRVFVETIIKNRGTDYSSSNSVSCVISHEACEIVGDPEINTWRQVNSTTFTSQELCDAVQGDSYPIKVGSEDIFVSNFLLPAWFDQAPVKGSKFDWLGKLKSPFSMTKGGYMINLVNGRVKNTYGSKTTENKISKNSSKKHAAARSARRISKLESKK